MHGREHYARVSLRFMKRVVEVRERIRQQCMAMALFHPDCNVQVYAANAMWCASFAMPCGDVTAVVYCCTCGLSRQHQGDHVDAGLGVFPVWGHRPQCR